MALGIGKNYEERSAYKEREWVEGYKMGDTLLRLDAGEGLLRK